jgi:hypothetical protein
MPQITNNHHVCSVALELSQSKWLCAFAPPKGAKLSLHTIKAGDHERLTTASKSGSRRAAVGRSTL